MVRPTFGSLSVNTSVLSVLLVAFSLGSASVATAQSVPYCPTSTSSVLFRSPVSSVIVSDQPVLMGIRDFFAPGFGTWDFVPQNVTMSGFQINVDAPGISVSNSNIPYATGSLGILPAGNYAVVVRGIATNVTPNVICPTFTVPLVVNGVAQNVPVPSSTRLSLGLLGLTLGAIGWIASRRRWRILKG